MAFSTVALTALVGAARLGQLGLKCVFDSKIVGRHLASRAGPNSGLINVPPQCAYVANEIMTHGTESGQLPQPGVVASSQQQASVEPIQSNRYGKS